MKQKNVGGRRNFFKNISVNWFKKKICITKVHLTESIRFNQIRQKCNIFAKLKVLSVQINPNDSYMIKLKINM